MRRTLMYVVTSLDHGGAETQVATLAREFLRRGWEVHVVSLMQPVAFGVELQSAGVRLASLGMKRGLPDPRAAFQLARLYRQIRPTVVHSHMVHANLLARTARLLGPLQFQVSTAHSLDEGGRVREVLYRLTDPMCDVSTNVSRAGVARYLKLGAMRPHKTKYVPNGIDTSLYVRDEVQRQDCRDELGVGNVFLWLAIGRLEEPKDYPNMLKALSLVGGTSELMIAGDGSLRKPLERYAAELGIATRVKFLGLRSDVSRLASGADGFVMSSSLEGLPLALLEAVSCGLPAVATDVGGISEVLEEGTGILVPPRNSSALAAAMSKLQTLEPIELEKMGALARSEAKAEYDIPNVVEMWEQIYSQNADASQRAYTRLARSRSPRMSEK